MKRGSGSWSLIITVVIVLLTGLLIWGCTQTQSWEREVKDIKSNWTGGLQRTVTVYTANGEVLKTYKGKIDLASTEGGIIKFDLNGQRIMYYNCYVEVIEESEE